MNKYKSFKEFLSTIPSNISKTLGRKVLIDIYKEVIYYDYVKNLEQKNREMLEIIEIYGNSEHHYWVEKTVEVSGLPVHYIKNIKQLEVLAREFLKKIESFDSLKSQEIIK